MITNEQRKYLDEVSRSDIKVKREDGGEQTFGIYRAIMGEDRALLKLKEIGLKKVRETTGAVVKDEVIADYTLTKQSDVGPSPLTRKEVKSFFTLQPGLVNKAISHPSLKNETTLLLYLIHHRAWKDKKDRHNTYDYWWKERQLVVSSRSRNQIAIDLGMSDKAITDWTNNLMRDGLIKKFSIKRENIYAVGRVVNNKEVLYYE